VTDQVSGAPEILFEQRGSLGLITLNRPKALNALTHDMCLKMKAQLDTWAADDAILSVAIQGAGDRAFCAGGDVRALYESGKAKTPYAAEFWHDEYILNAAIKHYPKPYVAFLKGIVMGGGVGVSVHGSHRIADETVMFAMPETGIGLIPDVGGSYFLPRIKGDIGMYMGLTGARLKTADCLYADLATHFVPSENTEGVLDKLAAGATPDDAISGLASDAGEAPLIEASGDIQRLFAGESVEAILSALDEDGSEWARKTEKLLRTKSPTSMKLTYRQIREGAKLDFDDCMRMEYRIVCRIIEKHDFFEGVRAVIVDKDGAPKWNPAELSAVSDADIDPYFASLNENELKLA
jgi:enoyl-CoA hydratase